MSEQKKETNTPAPIYDRELLDRFINGSPSPHPSTDVWGHVVDRDEVVRRQVEQAERDGVYRRSGGAAIKLSELPPPTGKKFDKLHPPQG